MNISTVKKSEALHAQKNKSSFPNYHRSSESQRDFWGGLFVAIFLFVVDGKKKIRKSHQIHNIVVPHHLLGKAERLIISVRWAHLPPRSHKFNIKSQYITAALPISKPFQILNQGDYHQEIPWDNLLDRYKIWIPEL